jgi:hypothetical protein
MMPPICIPCRVEMRCAKNNRLVRDPEVGGFPSTYWLGDEWLCPGCGARIVMGQGKALASHPGPGYGEPLEFRYELPAEEKTWP